MRNSRKWKGWGQSFLHYAWCPFWLLWCPTSNSFSQIFHLKTKILFVHQGSIHNREKNLIWSNIVPETICQENNLLEVGKVVFAISTGIGRRQLVLSCCLWASALCPAWCRHHWWHSRGRAKTQGEKSKGCPMEDRGVCPGRWHPGSSVPGTGLRHGRAAACWNWALSRGCFLVKYRKQL